MQVGNFEIKGQKLYGPKTYMDERGNAKVDEILAGRSAVVNYALSQGQPVDQALLVALQTDYAAWLGQVGFDRARGAER